MNPKIMDVWESCKCSLERQYIENLPDNSYSFRCLSANRQIVQLTISYNDLVHIFDAFDNRVCKFSDFGIIQQTHNTFKNTCKKHCLYYNDNNWR